LNQKKRYVNIPFASVARGLGNYQKDFRWMDGLKNRAALKQILFRLGRCKAMIVLLPFP
jgi:hypothetical protein